MHPVIRDEIYRIGREALVNALRHSGARAIELEIDYSASAVHACACATTAAASTSRSSRPGATDHWGLSGMRERADAHRRALQRLEPRAKPAPRSS